MAEITDFQNHWARKVSDDEHIVISFKDNVNSGDYMYIPSEHTGETEFLNIYVKTLHAGQWFGSKGNWDIRFNVVPSFWEDFVNAPYSTTTFSETRGDVNPGIIGRIGTYSLAAHWEDFSSKGFTPNGVDPSSVNQPTDPKQVFNINYETKECNTICDKDVERTKDKLVELLGSSRKLPDPAMRHGWTTAGMSDCTFTALEDNSDICCVQIFQKSKELSETSKWHSEAFLQLDSDTDPITISKQSETHYIASLFSDVTVGSTAVSKCDIQKVDSSSLSIAQPGSHNWIVSIWKDD